MSDMIPNETRPRKNDEAEAPFLENTPTCGPNENTMRNYETTPHQHRIEMTYRAMYESQTCDYVRAMKSRPLDRLHSLWEVVRLLDTIYDDSDPDTERAQSVHAYQTANALRQRFLCEAEDGTVTLRKVAIRSLFSDEEWHALPAKRRTQYTTTLDVLYASVNDVEALALVGFLHDVGKILLHSQFGELPQWSVVGDSFPVGAKLAAGAVFAQKNYQCNNASLQRDRYVAGCGFDTMDFSWGHDEYMATVLERNGARLPDEMIYLIRYHSFYPWHTPAAGQERGYTRFASEHDWAMLPLLKVLQSADLYSKASTDVDPSSVTYYERLLNRYLPSHANMMW